MTGGGGDSAMGFNESLEGEGLRRWPPSFQQSLPSNENETALREDNDYAMRNTWLVGVGRRKSTPRIRVRIARQKE